MVLASKLPLPDECIDLIVAYLVDQRQALHALVLSSQKLFQRAAPVLYRSPFQLIEHSSRWSRDEKEKRSTALLALLLTSRLPQRNIDARTSTAPPPPTTTTRRISTAAPMTLSAARPATPLDIHHYHQLQLQQHQRQQQHQQTIATVDYLRFFTHQYHVNLWRLLALLRTLAHGNSALLLDDNRSMSDLQTDVSHLLVQYCPEDVKVVGQPIARIPVLLVPHLQELRNLVRLELSEIPYGCKIEPVLEFIRVHDAVHGTLKEIKIKGGEDLNHHLEPTHKQLVRLVQAMRTAQVVDARHWKEAILVLDDIPVDCLRTLILGLADMPPNYISASDYLQRCAYLEELRMPVRDDRLFAWAVLERKKLKLDHRPSLSRSTSAFASVTSTSAYAPWISPPSPWQWRQHQHHYQEWSSLDQPFGLPRMRSLELFGEDQVLMPAVRDAVDAFRESLELLKVMSMATMSKESIYTTVPLSWSWPLSKLSVLDLEGEAALAFEFSALLHCPALITLRLSLPPYFYSSSEDDQILDELKIKMPQICLATRLLDLELLGKWPVSDELLGKMTRSMTRLTQLDIVSCLGYTIEGVLRLIGSLEQLERLAISKWLCARQPARKHAMRALNPRLELVEEP
ncbi:hypothetical protein BG015_005561 [Linnemannia schmuckeri]|uniref:Uncharacterized protein n=1 Tax=Linnemannia schmuckeri TaxID=64567 RepID=A0A9P5S481_9FUNG|nr:hypothetical protein BG015_005561 [Linnemannia schmuckeri]